ncbi:MAG TPA: TrmH family RNA methyltransferase [Parachlamydiaceae bacterium]|nr:TrmH family RNA methyltransferase [Parachlamydiaceae bacterium]
MEPFTKRKFLSLPFKQQQKKCAEILRCTYESASFDTLLEYNRLRGFLNQEPLYSLNFKEIADAYHKALELAEVSLKEHHLLPHVRTGDKETADPLLPIDIYLDNIRSGHNIGSILRTIEAFSLGEAHFSKSTPFIENKKVQDASMGCWKHVKSFENSSLANLKQPIIALETCHDAISIYDFTFPKSFTLVLGNEEYGCSEETLKLANYFVEIPLRGRKNSLNVANAFAIAASEIIRHYYRDLKLEPIYSFVAE